MARSRRWAATLALLASAVLLAGCATASTREVVSPKDRHRIGSELIASNWSTVADEFPGTTQPMVVISRTIPDVAWAGTIVSCLRDQGFDAIQLRDGLTYTAPPDFSAARVAVSRFVCDTTRPTVTKVTRYLKRPQIDALYRYYVGSVRPCLLVAGAPSSPPPDWFTFVTSVVSKPIWHPFDLAWRTLPDPVVRYLEQRCPPVPPWLDLGR
ncbi:hypothetical protein [Lacisediminihabitans sp.]|uniref:hypothetical protein n=1 Tax=Lacisediminihabitans sp. TaxID=2787631 RepID=UPI00374D7C5D